MQPISNLIIYYFSGTGNSHKVAQWLADSAEQHGIVTMLINIANIDRHHIEKPASNATITFISPIHGFNYPPVMMHFIMRFPRGRNKVLLLNTRAGMLLGKFITPGLSGIAFYLAALILYLKGHKTRAMYPVDMPSNWISVHPGLNKRTIEYLHERNKERVKNFAERVFSGKRDFRSLREIIQDTLISPIAVLYYFFGRFAISKTFYASSNCDGCDLCIKTCPVKAIKKLDKRPYWTFNCESCMHCMSYCPKQAIETAHGSIIGLAVLFSTIVSGFVFNYLGIIPLNFDEGILHTLAATLAFIILLSIWYIVMHFLMRFKFFERIMVYSSLTFYKFWGRRYRALKNY